MTAPESDLMERPWRLSGADARLTLVRRPQGDAPDLVLDDREVVGFVVGRGRNILDRVQAAGIARPLLQRSGSAASCPAPGPDARPDTTGPGRRTGVPGDPHADVRRGPRRSPLVVRCSHPHPAFGAVGFGGGGAADRGVGGDQGGPDSCWPRRAADWDQQLTGDVIN